jgi:hypothetical protein
LLLFVSTDRKEGRVSPKCREKTHSTSCRNSLICFDCVGLGHRFFYCQKIQLKIQSPVRPITPKPSINPRAQSPPIHNRQLQKDSPSLSCSDSMGGTQATVMKFTPNNATHGLQAAIAQSLVFYNETNMRAQYIQVHLEKHSHVDG